MIKEDNQPNLKYEYIACKTNDNRDKYKNKSYYK
jgi:hypothetical protein